MPVNEKESKAKNSTQMKEMAQLQKQVEKLQVNAGEVEKQTQELTSYKAVMADLYEKGIIDSSGNVIGQ